jgi:predicted membrane protein
MDRWEQRRVRWEERRSRRHSHTGGGLVIGALVVAVGLFMLLDNLDIVHIHDIWQYWPVLLIVFGVSKVLDSRTSSGYLWGGVVALVGAFLLLDNLHYIYFNANLIWPLVIIAFGVSMLLRTVDRRKYLDGTAASLDPTAGGSAVFSGVKRRIDSADFRGGDANVVFGEVQFDLRNAGMTVDQAVIDVNVVFGGVKIFVPTTWLVQVTAATVFGGVEDKTLPPKPDPNVKTPRLIISGAVVFGGINLYN